MLGHTSERVSIPATSSKPAMVDLSLLEKSALFCLKELVLTGALNAAFQWLREEDHLWELASKIFSQILPSMFFSINFYFYVSVILHSGLRLLEQIPAVLEEGELNPKQDLFKIKIKTLEKKKNFCIIQI